MRYNFKKGLPASMLLIQRPIKTSRLTIQQRLNYVTSVKQIFDKYGRTCATIILHIKYDFFSFQRQHVLEAPNQY